MTSFKLALAFIRIPRLFLALLFWPLVLGLFISLFQISISISFLQFNDSRAAKVEERLQSKENNNTWMTRIVHGKAEIQDPVVCRWQGSEIPLSKRCNEGRYDAAVLTDSPETLDVSSYLEHFGKSIRALHICKSCTAALVMNPSKNEMNIYSIRGMLIYMLKEFFQNKEQGQHYVDFLKDKEKTSKFEGEVNLYPGNNPLIISLSSLLPHLLFIFNVATLVLLTLWLAIKAHTKVLQYFSKNDALLPLVASCGKKSFYNSIWVITAARVGCFLLAAIPVTIISYNKLLNQSPLETLGISGWFLLLWFLAIVSSLSLVTMISSVAELKKRHSITGFVYQYSPIVFCLFGLALWGIAIFSNMDFSFQFARVVFATPILGLGPLLISPIAEADPGVVFIHLLLSLIFFLRLKNSNSDWFASHLGQI